MDWNFIVYILGMLVMALMFTFMLFRPERHK